MLNVIKELETVLWDRKSNPAPHSYSSSLFSDGEDEIVKKIGEEAVEVILAVKGQGNQRVIEETADLVYHILVLLVAQNLSWQDVETELMRRMK